MHGLDVLCIGSQIPACRSILTLMTLVILLVTRLLCQSSTVKPDGSSGALAGRIEGLFHTIVTTEDRKEDEAAWNEVKSIYSQHGVPTLTDVGDEAAYEFIVLLASERLPIALRMEILSKVKDAASRHTIPSDAAIYYETRIRLDRIKELAQAHSPTNPNLRDEIEHMVKVDQAVRQQQGFDVKKMEETDRQNAAPLQAILDKYGVPTYAMVGPQAAADFVTMIQHQPARFREEVLPKLKTEVDRGQADPESYALVYDRSQRDVGKKQLYGEDLECKAGKKLHEAPMEDAANVNLRRAELGLIPVELYERLIAWTMPQFCQALLTP
jgi:hypothetical protein